MQFSDVEDSKVGFCGRGLLLSYRKRGWRVVTIPLTDQSAGLFHQRHFLGLRKRGRVETIQVDTRGDSRSGVVDAVPLNFM